MKAQKEISENELLILIGRFYKEKNVELIMPFLHSNLIYACAWVDEILYGTTRFLNYIKRKFATQVSAAWNMDFVVNSNNVNMENSIVVCDYYDTGLLKTGEPVAIESIAGADKNLKNEFNSWINHARELLEPFSFTVEMLELYRPSLAKKKYYNMNDFELAKRIKSLVGRDFKIYFSCLDIEHIIRTS